ncbi:MAG: hypothetical protein AMXMBFR8_26940 [Nevskiales bacterium]
MIHDPPNRAGYSSDPFLRHTIANMAAAGVPVKVIARQLGLAPRRIRHELSRHEATRPPRVLRGYRCLDEDRQDRGR